MLLMLFRVIRKLPRGNLILIFIKINLNFEKKWITFTHKEWTKISLVYLFHKMNNEKEIFS